MGVLIIIALLIILLAAFDAAASAWGVDSRDQLPDDYRR